MRVEAKGKIRDSYGDRHYSLEEGDVSTVPDPLGNNWVENGWAKNLDTGEDNQPATKPVTLDVDSSKVTATSTEI